MHGTLEHEQGERAEEEKREKQSPGRAGSRDHDLI